MRGISYSFTLLTLSFAIGCGDDGGKTVTSDPTTNTDPTAVDTTGTGGDGTGTTNGETAEPTTGTSVPTDTGDDTTDNTTGSGPTSADTGTSDDSGPGETTSMTTGGVVTPLNGCDAASAEDHTGDAETTVTQTGLMYGPPCIRISAGSSVKFVSTFAAHPLVGGEVVDGVKSPDGASPITMTNMGMEASFVFPNAGDFGYYCDVHAGSGMYGAIFVE